MRTKSSIKNLIYAFIGQFIGIIVSFISRMVFINILGAEYLGINGLFTTLLSFLALVELGIGPAMTFSLYKPLANNDKEKVKTLMRLYKRAYVSIGIIVMFLGVSMLPFLPYLVKETPSIPDISLLFMLFVINSSISYFYSYKRSLIISDQKRYIATFYRYFFFTLLHVFQILILIITENYILFLIMQVLMTLIENIFVSRKADKLYPYLKEKDINDIDPHTKSEIIKNIKALVVHKLGGVIVNSTDNLIISRYLGLSAVGIYSNYLLIINALNMVIAQIFSSITASIGNLGVTESKEKTNSVFNAVYFMNFWIYGVCSVVLLTSLNPFIEMWLGSEYTLQISVVLIIVINFFLNGMRQAVLTFKEAMGLFWYDRHKPILEATLNLVLSLFLVQYFGMIGILIATSISTLFTCFWIEPFVLYKYGLKGSLKNYFIKYILYTLIIILTSIITYSVFNLVYNTSLISLITGMVLSFFLPNLVFIIIFSRSKEFKVLYNVLMQNIPFKKRNK